MNNKIQGKFILIAATLAAALIFACAARADVFIPISKYRKTLALNGEWKYSREDRKEFAAPEYDDSKWETAAVPARGGPGDKSGAGWYRKSFTLGKDTDYELLRFDQILDEGEVWLNGGKLINPGFQTPLEDRQAGVYGHVWTFSWPEYFRTADLIKYGARNVIAVRVTDDTARGAPGAAVHDKQTNKGTSGITGNALLISRPELYINAFERVSPVRIGKTGRASHVFRAAIGVSSIDRIKCFLKLSIFHENGAKLYEQTRSVLTGPNGSVAEFRWEITPRYESYRAVLHLSDNNRRDDEVTLTFHGTLVLVSGRDLQVNGQPFMIKGLEGFPGSRAGAGAKPSTFRDIWVRGDLEQIAKAGFNTIRIADPPQSLMKEAERLGIMIVPVIRENTARTVLALREYPNILYWDIDTGDLKDLSFMLRAISNLDRYRRPISYSNPDEPDLSQPAFKQVSIRGIRAAKNYAAVCGAETLEQRIGGPVALIGWGATPPVNDKYAAVRAAPDLRRAWNTCAASGKTTGVFYANLSGRGNGTPALRAPDSPKWNSFLIDILGNLFRDFDVATERNSSGGVRVEFKYLGAGPASNVCAYTSGGMIPIEKEYSLRNGQIFSVDLPAAAGKLSLLRIEYETNGGTPREFDFGGEEAVFDPDAAAIRPAPVKLRKNAENKVRLAINGAGVPREAEITLSADLPGVQIKPARRSVSIPAADGLFAPFTVVTPKNGASFLLTAVIRFTDVPGPAVKVFAVADSK
jgi:hypothetical protein